MSLCDGCGQPSLCHLFSLRLGLLQHGNEGRIFDIDFTGGTSVQVAFKEEQGLDISAVREAVSSLPDVAVSSVTVGDVPANLRYKIDTSERSGDAVEEMLRAAFPGRLATYSMGFGEIVSTADKSSGDTESAEETEAGSDPATSTENSPQSLESLSTAVELDFPQKINQVTLQETIEQAFKQAGHEGVAGYGTWNANTKETISYVVAVDRACPG